MQLDLQKLILPKCQTQLIKAINQRQQHRGTTNIAHPIHAYIYIEEQRESTRRNIGNGAKMQTTKKSPQTLKEERKTKLTNKINLPLYSLNIYINIYLYICLHINVKQ